MLQALKMAVADANQHGGVLGRKIVLDARNDACDPETAVIQANAMVDTGITASVGGGCSVATVPVLTIFRKAGIPMIIPAANSADLVVPHYDSVFLLSGTTTVEAARAMTMIDRLGARRMALVDDGTTFPQTLADAAAKDVAGSHNGARLVSRLTLSQGGTRYPRAAADIMRARADMVFFTGYYPEAAALIRDLHKDGYRGKIMLSDAGTDPTLLTQLTAAQAEGVYGLSLPLPQYVPRAHDWAKRFTAIYGSAPGPFTMQAYDAVRLALNAIERAQSVDRPAVRQAIADTTPSDITLLSGPSRFSRDGTQINPEFILLRAHGRAFVQVTGGG